MANSESLGAFVYIYIHNTHIYIYYICSYIYTRKIIEINGECFSKPCFRSRWRSSKNGGLRHLNVLKGTIFKWCFCHQESPENPFSPWYPHVRPGWIHMSFVDCFWWWNITILRLFFFPLLFLMVSCWNQRCWFSLISIFTYVLV